MFSNKLLALIPARYDSSSLPGKPLLYINDKTVIQRTYEQVCKSRIPKSDIYIVTDDDRIIDECKRIKAKYIKIVEPCENGTERIAKALKKFIAEHDLYKHSSNTIINIQGDEPYINPEHINILIKQHDRLGSEDGSLNDDVVCTTLHFPLKNHQISDRGIGKIVLNKRNDIIYCSRAIIPHTKTGDPDLKYKYIGHIGVFAFKGWYLGKYLEENTPAQLTEDIEWLKIIEQGYRIKSYEVTNSEIGINTVDDYKYLKNKYE